jgi:hypothetical protein
VNTCNRIPRNGVARRSRALSQTGVTLVEFALVIPFALLVVLGIIQMGLIFSAKQLLNEATFMAARAGAALNAQADPMQKAMAKALIPFYQDSGNTNDFTRLANALRDAQNDTSCAVPTSCFLKLEILNPSAASFNDFSVSGTAFGGSRYIPNDNLEFRSRSTGGSSGQSIQDANVLKIKVTYGYQLKVPLMQSVFGSVMCGIRIGIDAFDGNNPGGDASGSDCTNYYSQGRVPVVAYATVQMQSPAIMR